MSNSKSKIKKIICSTVLCFGLIASGLVGSHSATTTNNVSASSASTSGYITENVTSTLFGSGSDFHASTTSSTTPKTSFTGWSSDSASDDNTKKEIVHGVVDFKNYFDDEDWEIDKQPSMPSSTNDDDSYHYNLMINAPNVSHKFGYNSSKSISLDANSYYKISVYLCTYSDGKNNSPTASIYLDGILDKDDDNYSSSYFENRTTLNSWTTYSFYVETGSESKSATLGLWLGSKTSSSKGAVFFNNIEIVRYSEASYYDQVSNMEDLEEDQHNIISFANDYTRPFDEFDEDNNEYTTNHSSFESSPSAWNMKTEKNARQIYKIVDVSSNFTALEKTFSAPGSNGSIDNSQALFMYNKKDSYQASSSPEITIGKQSYYKLSFWAKSDCDTGDGATVLLVDKSEEDAIDNASLTLATTVEINSNHFRNDWTQYNFYIYGASQKDTQVAVEIWLGTKDANTSGYVFVDDFRLEEIDYDTFNANSSSSNSTTFNLNAKDDQYTIANGDFDKTQNSNSSTAYPLTPASWTRTVTRDGNTFNGTNNVFSGVISTNPDHFKDNLDNYGGLRIKDCPPALLNEEDNNVLMIGSTDSRLSQTYSSTSFTLSANSYYQLSLYILTDYTNNASDNNGARVTISSDTKTIYDRYNISNDAYAWQKICVDIKTGVNEESVKIDLKLEGVAGHIFVDKVELRTITENIYNNNVKDNSIQTIDLTYENFDNKTFGKVLAKNGVETPNNWTYGSNESDEVISGIINKNSLNNVPPSSSGNNSYLYISSTEDGNFYYTSKEKFTFSSETFYKISVNVFTLRIERQEPNTDDTDEETIYGASIALADSDEIILKGINTVDSNGDSYWKTYTLYFSLTEEISSAIKLSLGVDSEECQGFVLFNNLQITTFDSVDDYNAEITNADENTIAEFTNYTPPADDEDEESTPWTSSFNWVIVPSLITGLAIIIAVVGYYVRKITFNRKPKIKTNYDRRKTLDKDIDKREKIALRKQIIEELRAELAGIDQEIADFNVLAEEKLNQIKEQIHAEQEELKKEKLDIEIRKKEATANREKQLKESPDFVSNTKAEREYNNFIAKLDRQEMAIQRKINDQEFRLATAKEVNNEKLSRYTARQEYIRLQIAKIEAEIEEIARQEEEMWAEYKAAKADAKRRKAEYKAQVKAEKEKQARAKKSATTSKTSTTKKAPAKTTKTSTPKTKSTKVEKVEENSSKEN